VRYWWHNESHCAFEGEDGDDSPAEQDCVQVEYGDFLRYAFFDRAPFDPMRVIVCGGRDYNNQKRVFDVLDALRKQYICRIILVHGAAKGADFLAGSWARLARIRAEGVEEEPHPADWNKHGKAAGMIRNREMLEAGAELVIAFPGGRGTANMVSIAEKAGVPVRRIDW